MAYTVSILYTGPTEPDSITFVSPICSCFVPNSSYTDTAAYDGTVYDTNVPGFGKIDVMEPYASTSFPFPVPLAQFKLAVIGEDGYIDAKGKIVIGTSGDDSVVTGKVVTFSVDTYMEAFWYKQAGAALEDQGFTVEVTEAAASASAT